VGKIFYFSNNSIPTVGPSQPSISSVPGSFLFQAYLANLSPLSSAEVTTEHTSLLPHMSSWIHRENIFIILRMDVPHNRITSLFKAARQQTVLFKLKGYLVIFIY
jgi:hypothetical protein